MLHVVEAGDGLGGAQDKSAKTICLLHGFPDFWLSWRRQLPGLTEAGYRVLCPDLRGYAKSSQPKAIDRYSEVRCVCACHPVRLPAYIDTATGGARGKRSCISPTHICSTLSQTEFILIFSKKIWHVVSLAHDLKKNGISFPPRRCANI